VHADFCLKDTDGSLDVQLHVTVSVAALALTLSCHL